LARVLHLNAGLAEARESKVPTLANANRPVRVRPEDRQLLWLAHVDQVSHEEVAIITG
jgi:hypothetical protein